MRSTVRLFTIIFLLQTTLLVGTALLFAHYGGSIVHEIYQQDAAKFMGVADSLLATGHYRMTGETVLDSSLTPGYPFFVTAVFWLTDHSIPILLVILALLGAGTSVLIYLIGLELKIEERWSWLAGFFFGISPAVIWLPASGMGGDMVFVFLLMLALYLCLRFHDAKRWWLTALTIGVTLGLATLVRPLGVYFFFFYLVALPLLLPTPTWNKKIAAVVVLMLIGFYAPLLPWMERNQIVGGHFSLSSQFAHNPFYYNIPLYLAWKNHTTQDTEISKLMDMVGTHDNYALISGFTHKNSEGQYYYDVLIAFDKNFLKQHLVSYFEFHFFKLLPFFVGGGVNVIYATITNEIPNMPDVPFFPRASQNTANLFYGGSYGAVFQNLLYYWPSTLERIIWLALFILAFTAPFVTEGRKRRFALFGLVFMLAVAFLASPIIQPRYRIPAEPFIWLSAALALSYVSALIRAGKIRAIPRSDSAHSGM